MYYGSGTVDRVVSRSQVDAVAYALADAAADAWLTLHVQCSHQMAALICME